MKGGDGFPSGAGSGLVLYPMAHREGRALSKD